MARYALIICCTQAPTTGSKAIPAKLAESIADRWVDVLSKLDDDLSFSWPGSKKPHKMIDPTRGTFTDLLDNAEFGDGDELLLFYFGHSYPVGSARIAPAFYKADIPSLKNNDFSWVLDEIFGKKIKSVYLVLDTCHSGTMQPSLEKYKSKIYAMMAAENGYTRGDFSNHILSVFEKGDFEIMQSLHDAQKGGITLENIFEYANIQMQSQLHVEKPLAYGDLGSLMLKHEQKSVPSELRNDVAQRTVYRRVYHLIDILNSGADSLSKIMEGVKSKDNFRISSDGPGNNRYVSAETIINYLKFFYSLGFVTNYTGEIKLTPTGKSAWSKYKFNEILVKSIMERLFPQDVDLKKLKDIVWELLSKGAPPDAFNVSVYIRVKDLGRIHDPQNLRFAFKVLPYTGVFKRAPDAIFPVQRLDGFG